MLIRWSIGFALVSIAAIASTAAIIAVNERKAAELNAAADEADLGMAQIVSGDTAHGLGCCAPLSCS